jgi:hypothetical protein
MTVARGGLLAGLALTALIVGTTARAGTALKSGTVLQGEATDKKGSKFPSTIRLTGVSEPTGDFVGEITWPSLSSVHKIEGRIKGSTVVFKETAAIKAGQAHLNCEYAFVFDGHELQGRWIEPGVDSGTATYALQP